MRSRAALGVLGCIALLGASPAGAVVWHVDDDAAPGGDGATWGTAFRYLQDALRVAQSGDEVWVAEGVYPPDRDEAGQVTVGNRFARFALAPGIGLYGGFAGAESAITQRPVDGFPSVLTGDLAGNDIPDLAAGINCFTPPGGTVSAACQEFNLDFDGDVDAVDLGIEENSTWGVLIVANGTASTVADRITVTAGNATSFGAGLQLYSGVPTFRDCVFQANLCSGHGGGAHAMGAAPLFERCRFVGNCSTANFGGAFYGFADSSPHFVECTFQDNWANLGGAIEILEGEMSLSQCRFHNNRSTGSWGAALAMHDSRVQLLDCTLAGNAGRYGGGLSCFGSDLTLINSVFSGNRATTQSGGALDLGDCTVTATNCTFANNTALSGVGGAVRASTLTIAHFANCIFWGNRDSTGPTESAQLKGGTPLVEYSCVQNLSTLAGHDNTPADPEFVNPAGADGQVGTLDDDLSLTAFSACIDAADSDADVDVASPGFQPLPATDLAGLPRFVDDPVAPDVGNGAGAIVDMGAFEYQADCNSNGTPDSLDITLGASLDCDDNGVADECEPFNDCDANGVRDACEPAPQFRADCNANSQFDGCDIFSGASNDIDGNGVPDECHHIPGDFDDDKFLDDDEIAQMLLCLEGPVHVYSIDHICRLADADADFDVDLIEFALLQRMIW